MNHGAPEHMTETDPRAPAGIRRRAVAAGVLGVGSVIVAALATAACDLQRSTGSDAAQQTTIYTIGDCVTLTVSGSGDPNISKADCGVDPSYTVGAVVQADAACSSPNYERYLLTVNSTTIGSLCLAENLTVGHCYQLDPTGRTLKLVDCAVAGKGDEVAERLDNISDATQCPPNTTSYSYPTPARTYCLTTPQPTAVEKRISFVPQRVSVDHHNV
jgi:hypothetical protein